jgi:hypothetical protein
MKETVVKRSRKMGNRRSQSSGSHAHVTPPPSPVVSLALAGHVHIQPSRWYTLAELVPLICCRICEIWPP